MEDQLEQAVSLALQGSGDPQLRQQVSGLITSPPLPVHQCSGTHSDRPYTNF